MPLLAPMGFISAERVGRTEVWWCGLAPRDVSSFNLRHDSQVIRAKECVARRERFGSLGKGMLGDCGTLTFLFMMCNHRRCVSTESWMFFSVLTIS